MTEPIKIKSSPKEFFQYFRVTLILVALTLVFVLGSVLYWFRFGEVSGTEVGLLLNSLTGEIEVIPTAGTKIYNGFTRKFYTLDKTVQELEMVQESARGQRSGNDELKIKTQDGSNVRLDLTIQYQIDLSEDSIRNVLTESGPGDLFKKKWVRDYARSICRDSFGELTTEEFYDANKRGAKAIEARDELNRRLEPHGLRIISVIPENFRFYEEYEAKIREKKLADQEVEEQEAKARAAQESMLRMRVEATKAKEVAIQTFKGEMQELIIAAEAEAKKLIQETDAYVIKTKIGAEAEFFQMEKESGAIAATKKAEADGLIRMAEALEGEGGLNIVKMEYAARLSGMIITGQPFTISSQTERFAHTGDSGMPVQGTAPRTAAAAAGDPQ